MGDKIFSKLFSKPTDSHSYLEFNSCLPPQNKNSIPYSQFLRIGGNCTEWEDFLQNGLKLSAYFSIRGYPLELVNQAFLQTNKLTRNEILEEKSNSTKDDNGKKLFIILVYLQLENGY